MVPVAGRDRRDRPRGSVFRPARLDRSHAHDENQRRRVQGRCSTCRAGSIHGKSGGPSDRWPNPRRWRSAAVLVLKVGAAPPPAWVRRRRRRRELDIRARARWRAFVEKEAPGACRIHLFPPFPSLFLLPAAAAAAALFAPPQQRRREESSSAGGGGEKKKKKKKEVYESVFIRRGSLYMRYIMRIYI